MKLSLDKLTSFLKQYAQTMWAVDLTIASVLFLIAYLLEKYFGKKKDGGANNSSETSESGWL